MIFNLDLNTLVCTGERRLAAKQNVEDDTDAPNVALLCVVAQEDLRRDVIGRTVELLHLVLAFPFVVVMCCAEIDELE